MDGLATLRTLSAKLMFGADSKCIAEGRVGTLQTISGTGALTVVAHFLNNNMPPTTRVFVSDPTWPNHQCIFEELIGFKVEKYPYWDAPRKTCNIAAMCESLMKAPEASIVILHACAHNPTGEDPTEDEWKDILKVVKDRKHFAIIDCAYQGCVAMCLYTHDYNHLAILV